MSDHRFLDLAEILQPDDLLVVNETRVRAARLHGVRRETGGRIEILLLELGDDGIWEALARPTRRLGPGIVIDFDDLSGTVVTEPEQGKIRIDFDTTSVEDALANLGDVPLPPYFTGELVDPDRYQTMFAEAPGSAAAPTAGLHFTDEVVNRLEDRGIKLARVDLHVSLDTFRPMTVTDIEDHEMHSEWCSVPESTANAIAGASNDGGRIIAVGTTVVRTLESMADGAGGVKAGSKRTDLFLRPGSEFTVVDGLITNFHLPGSTLLVLLAGFMGDDWRDAYRVALERGYRFLSFGDAMFAVHSSIDS